MNNFLNRLMAEWPLRIGLGAMYLYSGVDMISNPSVWRWALNAALSRLPDNLNTFFSQAGLMDRFLVIQGSVEILIACSFLFWFLPKSVPRWASALSVLEMLGILILVPIDPVTFRDMGLLGASLSLFLILGVKIEQKTSPNG